MKRIDKALSGMIKISDAIASLLLAGSFLIMIVQVILRYVFSYSFPWAEELSRFLIIYCVFFAAIGIYRQGAHPKVEVFYDLLPKKARYILNYVFYVLMAVFLVFMIIYGYRLCMSTIKPLTPATRIPKAIPFAAVGIGSLLTLLQTIGLFRHNYLSYHNDNKEGNS